MPRSQTSGVTPGPPGRRRTSVIGRRRGAAPVLGRRAGATGAVGSTYNLAAPLYHRIRECFESGKIEEARQLQLLSVQMVVLVQKFRALPALKSNA